ncbi:MAG: hypothetical protein AAB631_00740 [Patescibacteria group bacterium]
MKISSILFRSYLLSAAFIAVFLGVFLHLQLVSADSSGTSVSVVNATPAVSNVVISSDPITLTENTTTTVTITATISDGNGCSDVFSSGTISAVLYRSGVAATSSCTADDSNCYRSITLVDTGGTCTGGTDTSGNASGTVPMQYFAEATDASSTFPTQWWVAFVKASDFASASSTATSTAATELNSLYALNITGSISYGSVAAGADTGASNQTATVTNTGNFKIDSEFSGTNMTDGSNTINATQQKYATSSVTYASLTFNLSTTATARDINIVKATSSSTPSTQGTFWGIAIPNGQVAGSYTGTNTFTAVYSSN